MQFRHAKGRWIVPLCLFLNALEVAQPTTAQSRVTLRRIVVKWAPDYSQNRTGDKVQLFISRSTGRHRVRLRPVYTFFDYTSVVSAKPWMARLSPSSTAIGVILRTEFGAGSGVEEIIIARVHGRYRQLFKGFSNKVEVVGEHRVPLVMRDLDGDGIPEIVFFPTFEPFRGSNPGNAEAEVWKWSPHKQQYVKVRTSPYTNRFLSLRKPARHPRHR